MMDDGLFEDDLLDMINDNDYEPFDKRYNQGDSIDGPLNDEWNDFLTNSF